MTTSDPGAGALTFALETTTRSADSSEPHPGGVVLDTPSLDQVWSLNTVVFRSPAPDVSFDDVERLLEERFAGRRYASAAFWDGQTGERMAAAAKERGWRIEREVFMALRRPPDRVADTDGVREGSEEEVIPLMAAWNEEELSDQGPEALAQLTEYARREWGARQARVFVPEDGLATCRVWSEPGIAQIEAVYTSPAARGRGYARKLLAAAVAAAREDDPDLIFIVADDDDTPKELYARLGFDPIARVTRMVRGA
jgi:ribosomal protein S18 acetylase RimI-like enzyme